TGDSPLIGFSKFLDNVISRTSGLNRDRIASAIFKGLESDKTESYSSPHRASHTFYPEWSKLDAIEELANAVDSDLRRQEIKDVSDAIDIATEEYWLTVSKWLAKVFPVDLDEVVISGGASRFLEPDLEEYFNCEHSYEQKSGFYSYYRTGEYEPKESGKHFTPVIWGAGFTKEIEEILALSGKKELVNSLSYRLVDAYGLFDLLIAKNQRRAKKADSKGTKQEVKAS
ncbi:MAG: hypothetical protein WBM86_18550, partial [Waterburya sp.]